MDATDICVGIDVSKGWLDVHVHPAEEAFRVDRTEAGLRDLVARLAPLEAQVIGIEATGGLEALVVVALAGAGLPVVVVNPAQVRFYAQALGRRAKTDPIEAAVIARFVAATKPPVRPRPDAMTRHLADLLARRRQIVAMLASDSQREHRTTDATLKKSILRVRKALTKEVERIDADIDGQVRASPAWLAKEQLLVSVPSVGPGTARTLMAELPELGQLDRRRIAALAGLAPWTRQSGPWKGKTAIGGGRSVVRGALFMAAMTGIRCNPVLKAFRDGLVARRKTKLEALVAAARKLLTILNAMMRDNKPWSNPKADKPAVARPKVQELAHATA